MSAWTYLAIAVTFGTQAMGTMVMYAPAVLAPAAHGDIGVSASSVGAMTSICFAGAVATILMSGRAINRLGPLRWTQISLVMMGCGAGLLVSANIALIALGGLIMGTGYGGLTPASSVILVKRVPARLRATILSIKQTGVPAGGALAGALIPLLILKFNWRIAVLIIAGVCILLAALIQPTRTAFDRAEPGVSPSAGQSMTEAMRRMWADRRLREIALATCAYGGMQMMFVSFFVVYLTRDAGLTLIKAGGAMAAAMIAGVLGRVLWGVVADRLAGARRLLGWLGLGTSASTVLMATITADWPLGMVYGVGILMGMTAMAWNGVYLAEVARIAPQGDVGMATSATLMFNFGGAVIIPSLCWAMVAATGSYTALFLIMAVLNLPVAMLLLRPKLMVDKPNNCL